jgi:prevent-host-death family protein
MDRAKAVEPVTVFMSRSAEMIRRARRNGQPILITQNGKATAVLQDIESYQRQREAILLLQFIARGDEQLRRGRSLTAAAADAHFRTKLSRLKRG